MAKSTGIALAVGGTTLVNQWVLKPMAQGGNIDLTKGWRIIPATAVFILALYGMEQVSPAFAKGIGCIALTTVLLAPVAGEPSPLENMAVILGYMKPEKQQLVSHPKSGRH